MALKSTDDPPALEPIDKPIEESSLDLEAKVGGGFFLLFFFFSNK